LPKVDLVKQYSREAGQRPTASASTLGRRPRAGFQELLTVLRRVNLEAYTVAGKALRAELRQARGA
jgi:hypothetical protein